MVIHFISFHLLDFTVICLSFCSGQAKEKEHNIRNKKRKGNAINYGKRMKSIWRKQTHKTLELLMGYWCYCYCCCCCICALYISLKYLKNNDIFTAFFIIYFGDFVLVFFLFLPFGFHVFLFRNYAISLNMAFYLHIANYKWLHFFWSCIR